MALIVLPTVACVTIASEWLGVLLLACFFIIIFLSLYVYNRRGFVVSSNRSVEKTSVPQKPVFLSGYRTTLMLMTCISILAVDFNSFPRRFAKTEKFGTGLMDLGVGSFVLSNGLFSRQARGIAPQEGRSTLRAMAPLVALGIARLVLTRGVDYQQHVGEYGRHWNFFFTLATVALLSATLCPSRRPLALPVVLALLSAYQWLLSKGGWSEFLTSGERGPDLFTLNKEGIVSSVGYWILHLLGIHLGRHLLSAWQSITGKGGSRLLLRLFLLDALLWLVALALDAGVERVSRRTCNAAYVLWILAQNLQVLLLLLVAELAFGLPLPACLQALDRNLLPVFLLANVLTGLVNISMATLDASHTESVFIISAYIVTILVLAQACPWNLKL